MARMATAVFRDEQDAAHFSKFGRRHLPPAAEGKSLRDLLRGPEEQWRLADLRRSRRLPGRHLIVATYLRQPVDYLTKCYGAQAKEVILGWAEWQEPACARGPPRCSEVVLGDESSDDRRQQQQPLLGPPFADLEAVVGGMAFAFGRHTVVVPPNSGVVYLPVVLESFRRALLDDTEEWKRWCKFFIPACFGRDGDAHGGHLGK
ncbi:uncharacterized protein THITE_72634 [Thermothielavioides terrestris NRRL 8126]|uniref:Uncharacterized protein n=1 Tax=Thermothielavioides terrestris (strain ATCC 38088 / NRRL 8126) TaxID=578455 RepID=G2RCS9_THETT|nr:uncharacterized protein THITE_72634 [Thermothielavioides terrestris NRRL 8126]AEO70675.1 hypothetical protein THITE_72634 [Thermothielavioides terrestris NRRL 8126]